MTPAPTCPRCKHALGLILGRRGYFYRCGSWPKCGYTVSIASAKRNGRRCTRSKCPIPSNADSFNPPPQPDYAPRPTRADVVALVEKQRNEATCAADRERAEKTLRFLTKQP